MKISNTGAWEGDDVHMHHGYSKPLVKWIADYLKDEKSKPLYDFGCGIGHYLQQFEIAGFEKLTGYEANIPNHNVFKNIKKRDLTLPFSVPEKGNCLFLEVAEHIPVQFEKVMLNNIINACDGKIIMSWAIRGQGGYGHINCLNNDEVIERFTKYGAKYLEEDTNSARGVIDSVKNDWQPGILGADLPWFKTTILIFAK